MDSKKMDSFYEEESSSEDEEWDQSCEQARIDQEYDDESAYLTEKMQELNVGYNPLKGYADGYTIKKWFDGDVRLQDVIRDSRLNYLKKDKLTAERVENFLECARLYVHHHRRKVPGTVSTKYIQCVAAAMIKWQYNI